MFPAKNKICLHLIARKCRVLLRLVWRTYLNAEASTQERGEMFVNMLYEVVLVYTQKSDKVDKAIGFSHAGHHFALTNQRQQADET